MQHKYRSSMELRTGERGEPFHVEDSTAWAVSYADLLMVLLSFFVIFYSADGNKKKGADLLTEVSSAFQRVGQSSQRDNGASERSSEGAGSQAHQGVTSKTSEVVSTGVTGGTGLDGSPGFSNALREAIIASLAGVQINVSADEWKNSLLVNLPENIFAVGKFEMSDASEIGLRKILMTLKPFSSKIEIIFIGHADRTVFKDIGKRIIKDNFALSSLRANSALQLARSLGFDDEQMFAQGAAANFQKSRTISLKIQELKKK